MMVAPPSKLLADWNKDSKNIGAFDEILEYPIISLKLKSILVQISA